MFGIGGGLVFLPTLLFILPHIGVENNLVTISAIATSLFAGIFSSSSSFVNHWKKDNVSLENGLFLGVGCVISASIVPRVIVNLDPTALKYLISVFLITVAILFFFSKDEKQKSYKHLDKRALFILGIVFGGVGSLIGFGGGVFYVPLLIYYFKGNIKLAVGTSTPAVVLTMLSAIVSFIFLSKNWNPDTYQLGYINILIGSLLGIGAVIGAWVGVKLIHIIPDAVFKKIFSVFLLVSIIKILVG